jgi:RNA polymerase sigma-70 factor, ECF subfamily
MEHVLDGKHAAALAAEDGRELDLEQFEAVVRANQRRVYRVLFGILRDADAAETLAQDCFLRAYQSRQSFRGECSVGTWLVRIAVNLARDRMRNRRADFWRKLVGWNFGPNDGNIVNGFADPHGSAETVLIAREQVAAVLAMLDDLSPQQRTAFVLRFAEEMSIDEVGQAMSLKPGTVKMHLFRAVAALRAKLKEQKTK